MKNIFLFLFIFCSFLSVSIAQKPDPVDSLNQILRKLPEDTTKLRPLIKLAQIYATQKDTLNLLKCAQQILRLADKFQVKESKIEALHYTGLYYYYTNKHSQSLSFFQQALDLSRTIQHKKGIIRGLFWVGDTNMAITNQVQALKAWFEYIEILEEDTTQRINIARTYNFIGKVFEQQQEYDKSLQFYQKGLSFAEKSRNQNIISFCFNNIGNFYSLKGEQDKALEYQLKALEIRKKGESAVNIAFSYNDIACVYNAKGDSLEARKYFLMAYDTFLVHNFAFGIIHIGNNLANSFFTTREYQKALIYAKKSLHLAKKSNIKGGIHDAHLALFQIYQALGDHQKALEHHIDFKIYSDSLTNESKAKEIGRLESFLELSKKEKENISLKIETEQQADQIRQQQLFFAMLGVVAMLLIALAWVLHRSNQRKKQDNELLIQQKEEINIQKEEIYTIAENLKDLNKELHKKNTNITASINYAKRIQNAILPLEEEMKRSLDDFFILWKPKDIVSGDFYWFHSVVASGKWSVNSNEKEIINDEITNLPLITILAAVDCTGHGVPGAFMSMIGSQLLNEIVVERKIWQANLILEEMNKGIYRILHQEETEVRDGMDISLCVIDKKAKIIQFSGAMNPLYYIKNNQLEEIRGDKHSLGGKQYKDKDLFTLHTIHLDTETTIYLFSDGYQDQFGGENNAKFSIKRFKELLFEVSSQPLAMQKQILEQSMETWLLKNKAKMIDDILVIGVKIANLV